MAAITNKRKPSVSRLAKSLERLARETEAKAAIVFELTGNGDVTRAVNAAAAALTAAAHDLKTN